MERYREPQCFANHMNNNNMLQCNILEGPEARPHSLPVNWVRRLNTFF
jgi:hypothetical protein